MEETKKRLKTIIVDMLYTYNDIFMVGKSAHVFCQQDKNFHLMFLQDYIGLDFILNRYFNDYFSLLISNASDKQMFSNILKTILEDVLLVYFIKYPNSDEINFLKQIIKNTMQKHDF